MAGSSEKKRLIESSAVTLFSEVGYGETSVRDIVSHSGTSLATFYRHYAGKQELLRALVEPRLAEVLKRVMAELETEPDPVERLLLAVRCGFDFVAEDQLFASLLS